MFGQLPTAMADQLDTVDLVLNAAAANHAIEFFEHLTPRRSDA